MFGGAVGASVNSSICCWSLILMKAMRTWSVPGLFRVVGLVEAEQVMPESNALGRSETK